jgi:Tfp pilus assembly protein PilX
MGTESENSSGQILLITLLVLTVAMTISLSVIGRSRTSVSTSTDVAESARAFSAAEAGVEEVLKTGQQTSNAQTLSGAPASYKTQIDAVGAAAAPYSFPDRVSTGDTATLWLVNHNADQSLDDNNPFYRNDFIDVCWSGPGTTPALSVIALYEKASLGRAYTIARVIFDPDGNRSASNKFLPGAGTSINLGQGCGKASVYKRTIQFSTTFSPAINVNSDVLLALRLQPLYGDADLSVDSGATALPSQGTLVTSTGSTGTGVTRKILVSQQFRSPPSIFDNAIVSQTSFTH